MEGHSLDDSGRLGEWTLGLSLGGLMDGYGLGSEGGSHRGEVVTLVMPHC